MTEQRGRNWWFVAYPDSLKDDWRESLDSQGLVWIESPLHDKDVTPEGETKKAHYHIMVLFSGNKSLKQIQEISDGLSGVKLDIPNNRVKEVRATVRYMVHADQPDKYQYGLENLVGHGIDLAEILTTTSDKKSALKEISKYILENDITDFGELVDVAMSNDIWFDVLSSRNTLFLKELVNANWKRNHQDYWKK